MYQKKREIKRTVFRGVVLWPTDLQALPPWGWCDRCGAEVYTPVMRFAEDVRKNLQEV